MRVIRINTSASDNFVYQPLILKSRTPLPARKVWQDGIRQPALFL
jgi:hypothetical protein